MKQEIEYLRDSEKNGNSLAAGQDLESLLVVGSTDDPDREVETGGFVHELQPVLGAAGEQMLTQGERLRMPSGTA
ncbi:hypothetical protein M2310_007476 [Rhizobium leguminosarum]|uniref:Uncharacterized protein n=1 Tax=Rhizobium esperanzae TaxID=1967781 RepID=A0A7W6Y002_9HYPH|nr:hypothetical protein [Rhizobium esperanzae]MDH6206772.1 hypothetical protein [Rhizobium leguminosarum]